MMSGWLAFISALLGLIGATPLLLAHPAGRYRAPRLIIGLVLAAALIGLALNMLLQEWLWFFVLAGLTAALASLGGGLLVQRLEEDEARSKKQRRKAVKRAGALEWPVISWLGALLGLMAALSALFGGS